MGFQLQELSQLSELKFIMNVEIASDIEAVIELNNVKKDMNTITWCSLKNSALLSQIYGTNIIIDTTVDPQLLNNTCNYILTQNPRLLFQKILERYFSPIKIVKIEASSKIDSSVIIGENCYIGHNVVIENSCTIGNNVRIDHNTVIKHNTIIGNNVVIGANCTIGGVGFGYEKNEMGEYQLIPHIGNVEIKDNVDIGNNTCIDRAVMGSTIIENNVKVDNLVHIAHGVRVNENSVVIANAMIGGSSTIGKNCWIAPSSSIINKITIGDESIIGLGAVVIKNIEENAVAVGNPAKNIALNQKKS
jgi:UDP-3-O-[3-hydroxymyristoyl] glucosamine N-acyltransferase